MTFMELLSNGSSRHDQELEGEPRSKIHLVLDLQETFVMNRQVMPEAL